MKILLDECVPKRLRKYLSGHDVTTVPEAGWAGIKNGQLLALAEKQFGVFITVDRNLSFQQHLPKFDIAVVILRAKTNQFADLQLLVPKILKSLPQTKPKKVTIIS